MPKLTVKRYHMIKQLYPYSKKLRGFFAGKIAANFLNMQTELITPIFFKMLIDDVMIGKKINMLFIVISGYLGVFLLKFILSLIETYTGNRFYNRFLFNIRYSLWKTYLKLPIDKYEKYSSSDLKMRIDENTLEINNFIDSQTYSLITTIISFLVNGIIMFFISWKLAAISIVMVPVTFYLGYYLGCGEKKLNEKRYIAYTQKDDWLLDSIQGWKEVKALAIERSEKNRLSKSFHQIGILDAKWIMYWLLNDLIIPAIKDDLIMKFMLYFVGGLLIIKGDITIGSMLIFVNYYSNFYNATNTINSANINLNNSLPQLERVQELLSYKKESKPREKFRAKGTIRFDNVTFAYNDALGNILENICLNIDSSQTIAVVGKSGSGKSTLVKLILDVISPSIGDILFDGRSISSIDSVSLHRNIGVVMQDTYLFNMSIRDNLKLAKPNATDEEIEEACKYANIYNFIKELKDGLDTVIGEQGIKLSGGQRQRMAIGRVFLSNPRIIIFDEATSSVDNESEKLIHESIEKLSKEKTVIIIAHRLSSVVKSDKVIVIKDKKIAGMGHHLELLGNNEAYDELFREQYFTSEQVS